MIETDSRVGDTGQITAGIKVVSQQWRVEMDLDPVLDGVYK